MCLLAIAWQMNPQWPLQVWANRDERHDRSTLPLDDWSEGWVGGRDAEAGGTWMALDPKRRRWAAVTNVREPRHPAGHRSRGDLPLAFLKSQQEPAAFFEHIQPVLPEYAGFNLLVCDGFRLCWLSNRHEYPVVLDPGIHVICNGTVGHDWPKQRRLAERIRSGRPWLDCLHDEYQPPDDQLPETGVGLEFERLLGRIFIRTPYYGTRCSSRVQLSHLGAWSFEEQTWSPEGEKLGPIRMLGHHQN